MLEAYPSPDSSKAPRPVQEFYSIEARSAPNFPSTSGFVFDMLEHVLQCDTLLPDKRTLNRVIHVALKSFHIFGS
jgi:hypothetical protein